MMEVTGRTATSRRRPKWLAESEHMGQCLGEMVEIWDATWRRGTCKTGR